MLQGSKQKKIFDYALKSGRLDKKLDLCVISLELSEASNGFYTAYKDGDMAKMVWAYCDFVFWLRVNQAHLISTPFGDDYNRYKMALELINGATNQGFLMLEILCKVVPVGQADLDTAMDYVINGYTECIADSVIQESIWELLFGCDIEKEE